MTYAATHCDKEPEFRIEWRATCSTSTPRLRRAAFAALLRESEAYPTFLTTRRNVGNYLWISSESDYDEALPDYDEALVDVNVDYIQAHPITQGYDLSTYWQAFRASRR